MPTAIINAGKATAERKPTSLLWRPSQWRDNTFHCLFAELSGGNIVASTFVAGDLVVNPFMLFLQDRPGIVDLHSIYGGVLFTDNNADTFTMNRQDFWEYWVHQVLNMATENIPDIIVNPTPAIVGFGQKVLAETATNGVEVSGFVFTTTVIDRGLVEAGPVAIEPTLHAAVLAQSGVLHGPNSEGGLTSYDGTATAFATAGAVILRESDYTQAMRTAGNVLTDGNGVVYRILGIHNMTQVA